MQVREKKYRGQHAKGQQWYPLVEIASGPGWAHTQLATLQQEKKLSSVDLTVCRVRNALESEKNSRTTRRQTFSGIFVNVLLQDPGLYSPLYFGHPHKKCEGREQQL